MLDNIQEVRFCLECQKDISDTKRGRTFCSRSCSTTFSNRKRRIRSDQVCRWCGRVFYYSTHPTQFLCSLDCARMYRSHVQRDTTSTIGEVKRKPGGSVRVRRQARKIYELAGCSMACCACGYDLHVDICHFIPVAMFTDETSIAVVNDLDNLIALCPNHHREFDAGQLELEL